MQVMRGKPVEFNPEEEAERILKGLEKLQQPGLQQQQTASSAPRRQMSASSAPVTDEVASPHSVVVHHTGERSVRSAARAAAESIANTLAPAKVNAPVQAMVVPGAPQVFTSFVNSNQQAIAANKFQPLLNSSSVLVSGRMLRLKSELLNLFYALPEKQLKWPEPDEEGLMAIEAAGVSAAATVQAQALAARSAAGGEVGPAPVVVASGGGDDDDEEGGGADAGSMQGMSQANIDKVAEKSARKAKRRLKRRMAIEKFVNGVLGAVTAQQLMDQAVMLEGAIPPAFTFIYNRGLGGPTTTNCLGAVALRIFTIDRSLRYDDMRGVEALSSACSYKLRTQFAPRCFLSASCNRSMCHGGKCGFIDSASRLSDVFDTMPPSIAALSARPIYQSQQQHQPANRYPGMMVPGGFMGQQPGMMMAGAYSRRPFEGVSGGAGGGMQGMQSRFQAPYRDEYEMPEVAKRPEKVVVDIENVQPYVPSLQEVTEMEWI